MPNIVDLYGSNTFPVTLTGYWPFVSNLTPRQRLMEGGTNDRKGHLLHTLQDHAADPVAHPYVALAGDYTIFKYGQRLIIPELGTPSDEWKAITGEEYYIARVVDTGGHFYGPNKVYRNPGHEPIDVCVVDSKHGFNLKKATAELIPGDTSTKGDFLVNASVAEAIGTVTEAAGLDLDDTEKLVLAITVLGGLTALGYVILS